MEWLHSGSPCSKKFRVQKSTGKVLASIFWGQDGILLINDLPKGQTFNAEYNSSLLVQMKDILEEKRCGKFTKEVLFLQDNAPAHRTLATQKKLEYPAFHFFWSPLPPIPWTEKAMERSPFFVLSGGHCCRGELVGQTTFWIFFEWLAKVIATG